MDAKPPYLSVGPFGATTMNRDPDAQAAEITALRAERDALAARLAVPAEEKLDAVQEAAAIYRIMRLGEEFNLGAVIGALRARVAGLEGALTELTELFDDDGYLNVVGDYQREVVARGRAALSPSAQEARDALR